MNGLTIITGINYAGKGMMLQTFKDLWERTCSTDALWITAFFSHENVG